MGEPFEDADSNSSQESKLIYDSPPSEADDDLWLAHGTKSLDESMPSLRAAASEVIKATGMLMTVYLAILGFAKVIPGDTQAYRKTLLVAPIVPWVTPIYYGLRVMKPKVTEINLHSPSDIRERTSELLKEKQRHLNAAFGLLIVGVLFAFGLVIFFLHGR
jgi:hypothetical protein